MCVKTNIYKILFLILLLSGCANSMYFYETEKISLTVEARPTDSSQPVQGNLGVKQRVALIVPKKSNDDTGDGEALSSISSFNFRIKEENWAFNPILIQTAFVTGDAATKLYDEDKDNEDKDTSKDKGSILAARVAEAIAVEPARLSPLGPYAVCIVSDAKSDSAKFNKLKGIANRENFDVLSNDEWKEFEPNFKACEVRTRLGFTNSLRKELQREINKTEK